MKTPIIYIHGIIANADFWPRVLPANLSNTGGCSISLPGHSTRLAENAFTWRGRSVSRSFTPMDFCAPILNAINTLYDGMPADLVGWSTGGFAALMAASVYPEKIRRVVSVSGFARGAWTGGLGQLQALATRSTTRWLVTQGLRAACHRPMLFDRMMKRMCARHVDEDHSLQSRSSGIAEGLCYHDMEAVVAAMADIRSCDITDRLHQIECPVLVISGTRDPIIPHTEALHVASHLRHRQVVGLEGCGHLFFDEARDRTFAEIEKWLEVE